MLAVKAEEQHHSVNVRPSCRSSRTALVGVANDFARSTLAYILESRHYTVLSARNLPDTVSLLAAGPDLVIIDDTLSPAQPLDSVVREIRKAAPPGTSVLLLADVVARDDLVNLVRSGTNHVVLKNGFEVERFFEIAARQVQAAERQAPPPNVASAISMPDGMNQPQGQLPADGAPSPADTSGRTAEHGRSSSSISVVPKASAATEPVVQHAPARSCAERAQPVPGQPKWERVLDAHGKVDALLERISQVRALPTIVSEVLALTGSGYSECRELVETLRQDVALTSRVLGLANSSLYRRQRTRVTSLDSAVKSIGFKSVREIALGVSIFNLFDSSQAGLVDVRRFWRHCFATASIARHLAQYCGFDNGEELYLTGLLHDVGVLILDEFFAERMAVLATRQREDSRAGPIVERECLAIDHARLGYEVMTRWKLPSVLTVPIRDHHSAASILAEDEASKNYSTAVLQAADMLAVAFGFGSGVMDYLMRMPPHIMRHLKLDQLDIPAIRNMVTGQVDEMQIVMGLYESRRKGPPPATDQPAARTLYIVPGRLPVDLVGAWCRNEGLALQEADDPDACTVPGDDPVLINLWGRAPTEPLAKACLSLPASRCMILCSPEWEALLAPRLPKRWSYSPDLVATAHLRRVLGLPDVLVK